jgi:hypothetical protein
VVHVSLLQSTLQKAWQQPTRKSGAEINQVQFTIAADNQILASQIIVTEAFCMKVLQKNIKTLQCFVVDGFAVVARVAAFNKLHGYGVRRAATKVAGDVAMVLQLPQQFCFALCQIAGYWFQQNIIGTKVLDDGALSVNTCAENLWFQTAVAGDQTVSFYGSAHVFILPGLKWAGFAAGQGLTMQSQRCDEFSSSLQQLF